MKTIEYNWDFKKSNTKEFTHCFHAYPAMMIPQIARRLISNYGKSATLLFDPYCGSGTSLVEANLQDIQAIGTDLNPLARIIAKAKTTPLDLKLLDAKLVEFNDYLYESSFREDISRDFIPDFPNIDFWFDKDAQSQLAIIKSFIYSIDNEDIKNFFIVAFSETIRESSYTKKGEFKLVRIPETKRNSFKINAFDIIFSKLKRNRKGIEHFIKAKKNGSSAKIYSFNTVINIPEDAVRPKSIDLVVTSPPYGDSRTTVAYGQYSRLSSQWLDIPNASAIDKKLMGGNKLTYENILPSEILHDTLKKIDEEDSKRMEEVYSFFQDYFFSIKNVAEILKSGAHSCYVVGNRTVKNVNIPMDAITADFFDNNGFEHIQTIVRNIPNKRMPSMNSPSNEKGKKGSTMKNEYIVICRKQ
ncbi:MAG: DNA methyltransferase [Candidatus Kapaibacterium sp.]